MTVTVTEAPAVTRAPHRLAPLARAALPYVFVAPILLLATAFYFVPIIQSFVLSLHEWLIMTGRAPEWVGFDNYTQMMRDRRFLTSFWNTWYFSLGVVPAGVAISLALALLLNMNLRFRGVFRTIVFLPVKLPWVPVAMVWAFLFSYYGGVVNQMLEWLGLQPIRWLSQPSTAMNVVIVTSLWKSVGFNMVVFLAGLTAIPKEYHEAAAVDGAGALRRFWFITLPLLRPTILFALVIATIGSFQVFGQVFVMTNGGPAFSTSTLVFYIYHQAFENFRMGYASAIAVVLFVMLALLTALQLWLLRRRVRP